MTRPEKISQRKAFNKAVRARAAEERTSFVTVLQRTQNVQGTRPYRSMLNLPTHPDRHTRRNLAGRHARQTESDYVPGDHESETDDEIESEEKNNVTGVVDLLAIARPAKVKGVAKEFEVVKRVRDVIVLEDEEYHTFGGEDWEEIDYDDESTAARKTYSAALSGT